LKVKPPAQMSEYSSRQSNSVEDLGKERIFET
jgi:hypothetical protein